MTSPNSMSPDPASNTAPPKVSVWEDFLDIFYAPAEVFRRRQNGNFWLPLLVVTLLTGALAFANRNVMRPVFEAEFSRTSATLLQKNPQLTQDALNKMRDVGFTIAQYGAVVMVPILILLLAFVAWLLAKAFQARLSWNAALVVVSFSMIPRVVQQVALSIQGLVMDPNSFTSRFAIEVGPGRFMDATTMNPMVGAVMDHLDIFILWGVVLTAIGVAVVAKLPKQRAWLYGAAFWAATLLFPLWGAYRSM